MSFAEKDYSLLAVSICKSREEMQREQKSKKLVWGSSATATLVEKVVKKIQSLVRSRSRYSRRKSTLVFNYSAYDMNNHLHGEQQAEEPQWFCPDLSASLRRNF